MDDRIAPLSPRLAAIAAMIPPGSRVADVGADHGRLALALAASGRASYGLSTELTDARLCRTGRPKATAAWAGRVGYRAGDGLAAILPADRIDTVVLAGLGGSAIVRMLGAAGPLGSLPSRLVLQPRTAVADVRRWLAEHGFKLVAERLLFHRGRFHVTVAAEPGEEGDLYRHPALGRDDLMEAGPLLVRSGAPEVEAYWRMQRDRLAPLPGERDRRAERVLAAISTRAG